jgi:hypothetical protein
VILFGFIFYRTFLVFIALVIFAGSVHYACYKRDFKLNLGHVFFIAVMLAKMDNLFDAILFLILAGFLPEILAGYIEGKTFINYPAQIFFVTISSFFKTQNILYVGLISAVSNYMTVFFLSQMIGEPIGEQITETFLPLIMNVVYFVSFAVSFSYVLGLLIPA